MTDRSDGAGPRSAEHLHRVAEAVSRIPRGRVASYGALGTEVGLHPRTVGRCVAQLPDGAPWWRVVRADGTPATCHQGTAPQLLHSEGVPFRGSRVDMRSAARPSAARRQGMGAGPGALPRT